MKLNRRTLVALAALLVLIAGGIAAFTLATSRRRAAGVTTKQGAEVWTCSMHPQVRLPKPGKCPICSMPLIRADTASSAGGAGGEPMLTLSEHARAMATVETAPVERRKLTHEIRAVGKVQYNETALATITARVEGYVERLFVDFTGVEVKAGDHLVEFYSPDFAVAQEELLLNLQRGPAFLQASRLKLLRWGLTEAHVEELIQTRKARERVTLVSPIDGTVTEKLVVQKSGVKAGDVLYRLANLESVWVYLDIYESQLPWVRYGQPVEVRAEAFQSKTFSGRVWFMNPVVTEESRTVKVLVNIANPDKLLKPGMFVNGVIQAALLANGELAPTGIEGQWTCPMHPQVLLLNGGECPVCKMALVQIPPAAKAAVPDSELALAVPASAVLDSGTRKLAYVERQPGEYVPAELQLGPRAGDFYPVLSGLKEGDRVAVRGNFLLDSQFQVRGLPSLFYAQGQAGAAGHQHGGVPSASPASSHTQHEGAQSGEAVDLRKSPAGSTVYQCVMKDHTGTQPGACPECGMKLKAMVVGPDGRTTPAPANAEPLKAATPAPAHKH